MAKKAKPAWDARKSAAQNARQALPVLTATYLRAAKAAANRQPSPRALHKFRLQTKRFRYTLELFRPCLGRSLDSRLEALRRLQQYLGEINDCATTRELLFGKKRPRSRPLARLWQFLEDRTAEKTAELMRLLRRSLRGAKRRRWWTDYAARAPRKPKRAMKTPPPDLPASDPPSRLTEA